MPIETLRTGQIVITYDNSHVYMRGRRVTHVSRRPYAGQLITVTTGSGLSSSYTPAHRCLIRVGHELDGKHIVYLMRRGDQFRIGRAPFFYASQGNLFGLALRASCEGADAAWILSLHVDAKDASLAESLAWHEFNIPGIRFAPSQRDVMDVRAFWEKHGPNSDRAAHCLAAYGRLADAPLWSGGRDGLVGLRRPFVTAAANLLDGFRVLPASNAIRYQGKRDYMAPAQQWETVHVSRTLYAGDIVSLEVADHHTYFADGLLTHNTARPLPPPARPGVTPAGQVAALLDRAGQGYGRYSEVTGLLTGFRPREPMLPFARPYVYGEPRSRQAMAELRAAGLTLHPEVHVARARRAGQHEEAA